MNAIQNYKSPTLRFAGGETFVNGATLGSNVTAAPGRVIDAVGAALQAEGLAGNLQCELFGNGFGKPLGIRLDVLAELGAEQSHQTIRVAGQAIAAHEMQRGFSWWRPGFGFEKVIITLGQRAYFERITSAENGGLVANSALGDVTLFSVGDQDSVKLQAETFGNYRCNLELAPIMPDHKTVLAFSALALALHGGLGVHNIAMNTDFPEEVTAHVQNVVLRDLLLKMKRMRALGSTFNLPTSQWNRGSQMLGLLRMGAFMYAGIGLGMGLAPFGDQSFLNGVVGMTAGMVADRIVFNNEGIPHHRLQQPLQLEVDSSNYKHTLTYGDTTSQLLAFVGGRTWGTRLTDNLLKPGAEYRALVPVLGHAE